MLASARMTERSWAAAKKALSRAERDELVMLIRDLYALAPGNAHFVQARLRIGRDPLEHYRRTIAECMHPDGARPLRLSTARKAISQYRKAASDVLGEIDLMIYFVECGNQFTLELGDINAEFYDSLLSMYARAAQAVAKLPAAQQQPLRRRLMELTVSSDGIGWGYHDGLCDEYYSVFGDADTDLSSQ